MGAAVVGEGKGKGKEEDFNGALHCAKAFGIATFLVGAGAAVGVYGVKRYTGVQSVRAPFLTHAASAPALCLH